MSNNTINYILVFSILLLQFGCKKEFNASIKKVSDCPKSELIEFSTQFNAADYGKMMIKTPDSLASTFDCYSKTIDYDILNKYYSLMMLKIYRHHIDCCEVSFDLKSYKHKNEIPLSEYSYNAIIYNFFKVTNFQVEDIELVTSIIILEWLNESRNKKLMEDSLIYNELVLIDSLKRINMENDRF